MGATILSTTGRRAAGSRTGPADGLRSVEGDGDKISTFVILLGLEFFDNGTFYTFSAYSLHPVDLFSLELPQKPYVTCVLPLSSSVIQKSSIPSASTTSLSIRIG